MPSKATNKVTKLNAVNSRLVNDKLINDANETQSSQAENAALEESSLQEEALKAAAQSKTAKIPAFAAEDIQQHLKRIIKLTMQAENPGMAYRNLETIKALAESLAKKLEISVHEDSTQKASKS